jgi:hypothetical protein
MERKKSTIMGLPDLLSEKVASSVSGVAFQAAAGLKEDCPLMLFLLFITEK